MSGNDDPRSDAVALLRRAVAGLPEQVREIAVRTDAGLFAGELARECLDQGLRFAIGAKRNTALWRAALAMPDHGWVPAIGMEHAEIAVCDYIPD